MGRSSDSTSSAPVLPMNRSHQQSISTSSNRFPSNSGQPDLLSSSLASSSSSTSSSAAASAFLRRSTSPPRLKLRPSSHPVRISLDRSPSPSRSVYSVRDHHPAVTKRQDITKRPPPMTCMCSPTSHPGSFRCSYHRNQQHSNNRQTSISCSPSQLNLRRSAMAHSIVRIGTVEGDWVKRALSALIRPSSHHQRRREDFRPRPSRLSIMSNAGECQISAI